eukprot:CAMPEP_0197389878 /NCGR_PEP_ID=MMETSP1165-20131217/2011_1 /TAXON_ID=284809 /ORGANISM="Chrysocystis fragilis, Strain CCMP3189" /LENGTH=470 /DNA_ID=CAMNT_0042915325 /DNA_START=126 /DNA_END=1538 /DNA_ORIENTATION=-
MRSLGLLLVMTGAVTGLSAERESSPATPAFAQNYLYSKYGWELFSNQSSVDKTAFSLARLEAFVPSARYRVRVLKRRRMDELVASDSGISPLFMGIGTHYAHVYVGSPPQRVSVIVDTGSHHTAFPCSGCKSCGHHTDPYFDPTKSKSLKWLECHECVASARCVQHKCQISQSYTEGSSWKAYQMRDVYYVGGETFESTPNSNLDASWLSTTFVFGCQTYETGLFRTQKADGIMGMSMHAQTLLPTMRAAGTVDHNVFALCFMYGGGIMAIGGVDRRIHKGPMRFTPLAKNSGWFTVRLTDIKLDGRSIDVPASVYASGKGTIVDSGTTDTYLPRRAAERFRQVWSEIMGPIPKYANTKLSYAPEAVAKFPTVTFVFENRVDVHVKPSAYVEQAGGKYIPRIYLSEAAGTVLGANFMQDHDIFFDAENRRIGFAQADCAYGQRTATYSGTAQARRDFANNRNWNNSGAVR